MNTDSDGNRELFDLDTARAQLMLRLRQNVITERSLLNILEIVPHEIFLPADKQHLAYSEASIVLGEGEQRWTPLEIARVISHLEVEKKHKVLLVGTGSGYMTAILSHLCRRIFALERARLFLQDAEIIWAHLGLINVTPMQEDGLNGWPLEVSFDRIVLCGGVKQVPEKIIAQLTDNGILIAPIVENSGETTEPSGPNQPQPRHACTLLKISRVRDNFHEQNVGSITTTMLKTKKTRTS